MEAEPEAGVGPGSTAQTGPTEHQLVPPQPIWTTAMTKVHLWCPAVIVSTDFSVAQDRNAM